MNNTDNRTKKQRIEDILINKSLTRTVLIEQNVFKNKRIKITSQCIMPKNFFIYRGFDDNIYHTLAAYKLDYDIINNKKCYRCGLESDCRYCKQCQHDLFII